MSPHSTDQTENLCIFLELETRNGNLSGTKARIWRKIGIHLTRYGHRRKIGAVILKTLGLDRWL